MRGVCDKGAASLSRLRQAVGNGSLASRRSGLGAHLGDAMAVRSAASMATVFFGVPRASEFAGLPADDVGVDTEAGVVDLEVHHREDDQYGLGQLPYLPEVRSWGRAWPARLLFGWMQLWAWSGRNPDHFNSMSRDPAGPRGNCVPNAFFAGPACSGFGLGMAHVGVEAGRERPLRGSTRPRPATGDLACTS